MIFVCHLAYYSSEANSAGIGLVLVQLGLEQYWVSREIVNEFQVWKLVAFPLQWIALADFTNFFSMLYVCRGIHTYLKTRLLWGLDKIMATFSFLPSSVCLFAGHNDSGYCGLSPELLSSLADNLAQPQLFKVV